MSCCGNKRKEWLAEVKSSPAISNIEDEQEEPAGNNPDRIFEYTGNYSFTITGVATGKTYHFRFQGDRVKVDYNDSYAFMAERNLKISAHL